MALGNCYAKLMIGHLLKLEPVMRQDTDRFRYGRHTISKVEIVGTITSMQCFPERTIYEVEDGTGSIKCADFPDANHVRPMEVGAGDVAGASCSWSSNHCDKSARLSPDDILEMVRLQEEPTPDTGPIRPGELVMILGRLKEFRGVRTVNINVIKVLNDPNWESFHMIQQVELYRKIYDS